MTYGDVYSEFKEKFSNVEAEDYIPADPMYIPQLMRAVPNAIIVWLEDGSTVIYISGKESK